jgi:hypothetical protein
MKQISTVFYRIFEQTTVDKTSFQFPLQFKGNVSRPFAILFYNKF